MSGRSAPPVVAEPQEVAVPSHSLALTTPGTLLAEDIRQQLQKILGSKTFIRSKELRRFLHYVVEQRLKDHSVRLKEYLIGVTVFGRGETFNPGMDPIVRVQARRLRSKLNLYYQTEGRADSVSIQLPRGCYAPVFGPRSESAAEPAVPAGASRPAIVVLPFTNSGPHENEKFSDGLTEELIHALSTTAGLRVLSRTAAFQFKGKTDDIRNIGERLGVDAVVEGSVRADGNRLRVSAGLIDVRDGGLLWSAIYDHTVNEMFTVQRDIAERIAGHIEGQLPDVSRLQGTSPTPA